MGHQQWFHHIDEKKCRPSITSTVWRQDTPRLLKTCAVAIGKTCPSQNIVLPFDGIDAREEYNSCKYANINIRLEKLVFETQAQNLRSSCPSSRQQTPDRCIRRRTSATASRFGRAEQPCRGPCMDMGRAGSKRWLRSGCIGTDE